MYTVVPRRVVHYVDATDFYLRRTAHTIHEDCSVIVALRSLRSSFVVSVEYVCRDFWLRPLPFVLHAQSSWSVCGSAQGAAQHSTAQNFIFIQHRRCRYEFIRSAVVSILWFFFFFHFCAAHAYHISYNFVVFLIGEMIARMNNLIFTSDTLLQVSIWVDAFIQIHLDFNLKFKKKSIQCCRRRLDTIDDDYRQRHR